MKALSSVLIFLASLAFVAFSILAILSSWVLIEEEWNRRTVPTQTSHVTARDSSAVVAQPSVSDSGKSNAIFGLAISILGISAGVATLIPFFISRFEVKEIVLSNTEEKFQELRQERKNEIENSIFELQKLDAHASRMIGWILVEEERAVVWGIGWLARSIKKYPDLLSRKPSYGELLFLAVQKLILGFDVLTDKEDDVSSSQVLKSIALDLRINEEEEPYQPAVRACKDALDVLAFIDRAQRHNPDLFTAARVKYIKSVLENGTAVILHVVLDADDRFKSSEDLAEKVKIDAWSKKTPGRVDELLSLDFTDVYEDLRRNLDDWQNFIRSTSPSPS
jgi:hypothetical protein